MDERTLQFHPETQQDFVEVIDWYAERSPNVARAFQETVKSAGLAISKGPVVWPAYLSGTWRYILKRFPFAVVFRLTDKQIQLIAVAHGSRRPDYWADRRIIEQ